MSVRGLVRLLFGYVLLVFVTCAIAHSRVRLHAIEPGARRVVDSLWSGGHRARRSVREPGQPIAARLAAANSSATAVEETAVAEGPLSLSPLTFPYALVPGRDGARVEVDGKTAWATVDDLLGAQAYDHARALFDPTFGLGVNEPVVLALLATQLGVTPADVLARGHATRVRFERNVLAPSTMAEATTAQTSLRADRLDRTVVRNAARDAALFVARGVDVSGRYRYLVDATTNQGVPGYNWPRHSGTTYFLAQAAVDNPDVRAACLRAAALLRDELMKDCGQDRCIAEGNEADVGSSALALMAFAEIVRTGLDPSYLPAVRSLAGFLRSQQRPDGELMHRYDRAEKKPIDVQLPFFTGEAALALSRAHLVTADERDRVAASRALARLSGDGWSFFGSRYYFNEEHWTCQAMADLWERAPDRAALDFCLRWHEWQRHVQFDHDYAPYPDEEGGFGFGPFLTPRTTSTATRGEAAAAALSVLEHDPAALPTGERARAMADLDAELRGAIAFILREQLRPGARHLFAQPELTQGAIPGSAVDLQLRIDYTQHAGSMLIRWLALAPPP